MRSVGLSRYTMSIAWVAKCLKYFSNRPNRVINGFEQPVTLNTVLYVRNINQIQWSHHAGNQLKLLEIIQFLKAYERPSMTDTG